MSSRAEPPGAVASRSAPRMRGASICGITLRIHARSPGGVPDYGGNSLFGEARIDYPRALHPKIIEYSESTTTPKGAVRNRPALSLTAATFAACFFGPMLAPRFRNPLWGLYAYIAEFHLHPLDLRWGRDPPDRWTGYSTANSQLQALLRMASCADARTLIVPLNTSPFISLQLQPL